MLGRVAVDQARDAMRDQPGDWRHAFSAYAACTEESEPGGSGGRAGRDGGGADCRVARPQSGHLRKGERTGRSAADLLHGAGMEAARIAALRGHKVVIFEKENELGGVLRTCCMV